MSDTDRGVCHEVEVYCSRLQDADLSQGATECLQNLVSVPAKGLTHPRTLTGRMAGLYKVHKHSHVTRYHLTYLAALIAEMGVAASMQMHRFYESLLASMCACFDLKSKPRAGIFRH